MMRVIEGILEETLPDLRVPKKNESVQFINKSLGKFENHIMFRIFKTPFFSENGHTDCKDADKAEGYFDRQKQSLDTQINMRW
jgi:hypothetical protein